MISDNIKEYTKTAHTDLEKIVVQKLKDVRSETDYAGLLKYFYAYFSALETAIAPYINQQILADYDLRRKADKLEHDIQELGSEIANLPQVTLPKIGDARQAMGALYVMEGSVLGGTIIVQMLKKAGINTGLTFFGGYGEDNGTMWGKFVMALNKLGQTSDDERSVLETAAATFTHFKSVFNSENNPG
ncbi:heme oxygenase [Mucilaginibacter hurinus]|uniref:Heme oxygenase n=1 Tax=Mucilaginibacter hurinus TaxID=2201324 RepID=A0A367GPS9_9SPHI|nr:biliverdin-producing heme oxygenase [Mucilaginibacter hurinus]RCH55464.1 heme oxygenase [Mucilaginibacter hurinus]